VRRTSLEENLIKMDEKFKDKIRDLEETLVNEELIPAPQDDGFYDEPSPFENMEEEIQQEMSRRTEMSNRTKLSRRTASQ